MLIFLYDPTNTAHTLQTSDLIEEFYAVIATTVLLLLSCVITKKCIPYLYH